MSDYVPSEAGARLAYVDGLFASGTRNIKEQREELRAEFDRFIAHIKAKARAEAFNDARHTMQLSLDAAINPLRAEAWDEGYAAGQADHECRAVNPHRDEREADD